MSLLFDVASALVTSTMVGNEFAVSAFVHPQIARLDETTHVRTAKPLAAVLGRAMPAWYILGLLMILGETVAHRPVLHGPGLLCLLAAILWVATIILTLTALVPINNRIAKLDPAHPYPGWLADRARWDSLHRIRVGLLAVAVVLLLSGLFGAAPV